MSKTILRGNGFPLLLAIMLLGSFFIITSCGGGGGGGGGVSGITYDGLITQASITSTNANIIFSEVWNGGSSSGSAAFLKVSSTKDSKAGGMAALFRQLTDRAVSEATSYAAQSNKIMSATQVNETQYDGFGGRVTITGSINDNTGTGSLTITFVNFNDGGGITLDGTIVFRIDGFDTFNQIITDGTMSFTLWRIRSANFDISFTGSIRALEIIQNNSETLTVNLDGRDNSTGDTFRFKNFVETAAFDDILSPFSPYTETISGRVYVRQHGYVDVTTTTPLNYTSFSQEYPDSGEIILAGENGSKARITPLSTLYVKIEVDVAPGDGIYDYTANYAWSNLAGDPVVVP